MDCFKIVLIILAVYLVYCYLKNNGYFKENITIFEGATNAQAALSASLEEENRPSTSGIESGQTAPTPAVLSNATTHATALEDARDPTTYGSSITARGLAGADASLSDARQAEIAALGVNQPAGRSSNNVNNLIGNLLRSFSY